MKITRVYPGDVIDLKKEESCIYYGIGSRILYEEKGIFKCREYCLVKLNLLVVGDYKFKGMEYYYWSDVFSAEYWNNEMGGEYFENY